MPEVTVNIGGRPFVVACQAGEEGFLHAAADRLNEEALTVTGQIGQVPESRMLLMAGLLLADKIIAVEQKTPETKNNQQDQNLSELDLTHLRELVDRAEKIAAE